MRLWHYKLIPYLPNSQLKAQWRELNSIFKGQPNHILINYVYEEKPEALLLYSWKVINEMQKRGLDIYDTAREYYFDDHNDRYLLQCFCNLQEKYDRGQKDFSRDDYKELEKFAKDSLDKEKKLLIGIGI